MADIVGTSGNDTLAGTAGADTIFGYEGDDVITGGGGDDRIDPGTGIDRVDAGSGNDTVALLSALPIGFGATGYSTLDGGTGIDTLSFAGINTGVGVSADFYQNEFRAGSYRFANFEKLVGSGLNDFMNFYGATIALEIEGGAGEDYIRGGSDNDTVRGGAGNDDLSGEGGTNNLVYGEAGDDTLYAFYGGGVLDGGEGTDTLQTYAAVDLTAGTATNVGSQYRLIGIENVTVAGGASSGTVIGSDAANRILTTSSSVAADFDGRGGSDVLLGGALADTLRGGSGDDAISGGAGNDRLSGDESNDVLTAGDGADTLDGGAGDDVLVGEAGADRLSGGTGTDRVAYDDHARRYAISAFSGTAGTVSGGYEGSDTLSGIEYVAFRDGYLTFDAASNAAKVMRLYDSVLARAPDAFGLDAWLDALDAGASFGQVAQGFLASPEFQRATGSLSNADYVEYLYVHALGRASDAQGKAGWVAALDGGTSRADVLVGFSESDEHRGLTADRLGRGLFVTDNAYQQVAALYDTFANRRPDADGLDFWTGEIKSGQQTLAQVAEGFAGSVEFRSRTDGLSNADLVEFMYANTLDRGSDPGGKAGWVSALDGGLSRGGLILAFAQSVEHLTLIAPDIQNGIAIG